MTDSWDSIADWYAARISAGSPMHEFARDALLDCLPPNLTGQRVVDVGCGEGLLTRAVAARGASAFGIDKSARMISLARDQAGSGTGYAVDDGCTLATIADSSADWVIAGLSLNNVPDLPAGLASIHRILVPGGRLAFSIPHPCFEAPCSTWTESGNRVVGSYAAEGFWRSPNPQGVRRAGNEHRMLSTYISALVSQGFTIEALREPLPDAKVAASQPKRATLPPFLIVLSHTAP
jgi:SAM-dependent methyltransferase